MEKVISINLLFFLLAIVVFPETGLEETFLQRFAFVVWSKEGDGKPTLQYADKDAGAIKDILNEMGGVLSENMIFLDAPGKKELKEGFEDMKKRIRQSKEQENIRTEIIFYYSGHSDEENLLLGQDRYPYKRLKDDIKDLGCTMTFVILDCCYSGRFITAKGGVITVPFIYDRANEYSGFIYLASCRETEESYESAKIGGSLYTYALASGLRGAADMNRDGNVTLNEISDFANQETRRLVYEENASGQEPIIKADLEQTGKIVMTDINETSSRLIFMEEMEGIITIIDKSRNTLSCEFFKTHDTIRSIGLPEGDYKVKIRYDHYIYTKELSLEKGIGETINSLADMEKFRELVLPKKGSSHGFYSTISIGAGPVIPLGKTGEYTGFGVSPQVAYYLMFPGNGIDWGIGVTTGVQYEESIEHDQEKEIPYSMYNVPGTICFKMILSLPRFPMDFYMEASVGIVGAYQDFQNSQMQNNIASRFIGTGCAGIGMPLNSIIKIGACCRITVIPVGFTLIPFNFVLSSDKTYINCTPGLFIDVNLNKKERIK